MRDRERDRYREALEKVLDAAQHPGGIRVTERKLATVRRIAREALEQSDQWSTEGSIGPRGRSGAE